MQVYAKLQQLADNKQFDLLRAEIEGLKGKDLEAVVVAAGVSRSGLVGDQRNKIYQRLTKSPEAAFGTGEQTSFLSYAPGIQIPTSIVCGRQDEKDKKRFRDLIQSQNYAGLEQFFREQKEVGTMETYGKGSGRAAAQGRQSQVIIPGLLCGIRQLLDDYKHILELERQCREAKNEIKQQTQHLLATYQGTQQEAIETLLSENPDENKRKAIYAKFPNLKEMFMAK